MTSSDDSSSKAAASEAGVRFAKRTFLAAGVYGLMLMPPMAFLEDRIGVDTPPPITHPEFFYGFLGVTIAWQVAFVLIARDPVRFRPLMAAAMIEKFSFGAATMLLFRQGRIPATLLAFGLFDVLLGLLFVISWRRTRPPV